MVGFLGLDVFTWLLVLGLGLAVPLWGRREIGELRVALEAGDTGARLRHFDSTIRWQWVAVLGLVAAWILLGRSGGELGLVFAPDSREWIAIGVGLVLGGAMVAQSLRAAKDDAQMDALGDQLGDLDLIAPRSAVERRRFVALSITAGVCEELIYRGVLVAALASHVGLWPAAVLSSVVFGLGHAYQGPMGIVRTGAVGLVFAVLMITTGSLWVPMLLHALLDVFQGRVLARAAERRDATKTDLVHSIASLCGPEVVDTPPVAR